MGFDSFELLIAFPSGGVCRMLCVGDICAEVNRLSEFCHRKKNQIVITIYLFRYNVDYTDHLLTLESGVEHVLANILLENVLAREGNSSV